MNHDARWQAGCNHTVTSFPLLHNHPHFANSSPTCTRWLSCHNAVMYVFTYIEFTYPSASYNWFVRQF